MFLKALQLKNFRNYSDIRLDFGKNTILIIGDNGLGKTNLLESINYLSSGKSHRTGSQDELIKWGSDFAVIRALSADKKTLDNHEDKLIELELNMPNKIKIRINRAVYKKKSDFISILPSVIFSPDDLAIIKGGPSLRRGWLDGILEKTYPGYYNLNLKYQKILNQRNSLIKSIGTNKDSMHNHTLQTWDENLVKYGTEVILARASLLGDIKEDFARLFGVFFKDSEARLSYIFSWDRTQPDNIVYEAGNGAGRNGFKEPFQDQIGPSGYNVENYKKPGIDKNQISRIFKERLEENFKRELNFKTTVTGPHRDDFLIMLNGKAIKSFGSQGQQRIAAVCLKFCELEILRKKLSKDPILLLDDVLSELDRERENQVLNLIGGRFQTFITTSNINFIDEIEGIDNSNIQKFLVAGNKVSPAGDG